MWVRSVSVRVLTEEWKAQGGNHANDKVIASQMPNWVIRARTRASAANDRLRNDRGAVV